MAISRTQISAKVIDYLPIAANTTIVPEGAIDGAIDVALLWHSRYSPRTCLTIGTGDGSTSYFDLPSDLMWVKRVESPYGGTPPTYIADWEVHYGTAGYEIVFETPPGSGDLFGIHYAGKWSLDHADEDDIPLFASLAAAWICIRQASRMAQDVSTTINADTTDYARSVSQWIRIKEQFIGLYARMVGLSADYVNSGAPPPAFRVGALRYDRQFDRWFWA